MSEHNARDERQRMRAEDEARAAAQMKERILHIVKEIKDNYDAIKSLCPETSPDAWKSMLFLRRKIRHIRAEWHTKILDARTTNDERQTLLGQYNAALLVFNILEQFREINKKLIPGKEEESVAALLRQRQPQPPR